MINFSFSIATPTIQEQSMIDNLCLYFNYNPSSSLTKQKFVESILKTFILEKIKTELIAYANQTSRQKSISDTSTLIID